MPVGIRYRPSLRLVLIGVNLFLLIIPVSSIYAFRLYENALIRETESELIAQGAYISALYGHTVTAMANEDDYGLPIDKPAPRIDAHYNVIHPTIDLAKTVVQSRRPESYPATAPADAAAVKAAQQMTPIVRAAMLTTLAGVRLTDQRGTVILGADEVGMSLLQVPEVRSALEGRYTSLLRRRMSNEPDPALTSISRGNDIRVFVAMPVIHQDRIVGSVLLSRSPRSVSKALYDDRQQVGIAASIVVGIILLMALLTSRAIGRPIHALIAQTQRIAGGAHEGPIRHPVTKELALLSQNIAQMAQTIQGRSDYIRNFATHVSHEFKTPLTAIQGAVELIQEHGSTMQPAQQQKFLDNIRKDTARLAQLVTRLLDLARADVMEEQHGSCTLAELLPALQASYPALTLQAEGDLNATLPLAQDLARSIIGSLIENSQQHGATHVQLRCQYEAHGLELLVQDNGPGISPANAAQLFTPFFTTKRDKGGTGLGLSIAQALLRAHHAQIQHRPTTQGACFAITFR
ncbi:MAG: sensor histidine kinase [Azospirillum brasilense]|nr:MAG: sensor histidine kinase [Azospirillum brasilense]